MTFFYSSQIWIRKLENKNHFAFQNVTHIIAEIWGSCDSILILLNAGNYQNSLLIIMWHVLALILQYGTQEQPNVPGYFVA
jgi:hypothetical protein